MKLTIPIVNNNGLNSQVYNHFGNAPLYLIFDSETNDFQCIENKNKERGHGQCHPVEELIQLKIDAVICNAMGLRAINNLNRLGIKVYSSNNLTTAKEIVESFRKKELPEISVKESCKKHHCH